MSEQINEQLPRTFKMNPAWVVLLALAVLTAFMFGIAALATSIPA